MIKPFVGCTEAAQTAQTAQNPRSRCTATPSPIPRIAPKVASKCATIRPTKPRINSRIFLLVEAKGNGAANCPHHLKVANPSATVAESSPARCVSEREKGGYFAPAGSKGRSPWRFFGDFLIGEKVTRVRGGAPAWEEQGPPPLQNPLHLYPQKQKKLHLNVQPLNKKSPLRGEKSALRSS